MKFSVVRSFLACVVAVEAGALAACIATMILDSGLRAILEGIRLWGFTQPLILFIALCAMPFGACLRMILGLAFDQPRRTALITGGVVGLVGSGFIALSVNGDWADWLAIASVGVVSGVIGGWVWWRIEKPFIS